MTLSSLRARILSLFGITRLWSGRRCWRCERWAMEEHPGYGWCERRGYSKPNAVACGTEFEEREFEEET